jgi:glyoxylase I family protein
MRVGGIHHITIRVQDPDRSRDFYHDVLGFDFVTIPVPKEISDSWRGRSEEGQLYASQVGSTFFILAPPLEGTAEEDRFSEYRIGVDHVAFAVPDRGELEAVVASLKRAQVNTEGIEVDPVLNKEYVAFRDPDNIQLEFYTT